LGIVSSFVLTFLIFVQVYRKLPPGGNQIVVNKYHIISLYGEDPVINISESHTTE